jgi:hypothetical protein
MPKRHLRLAGRRLCRVNVKLTIGLAGETGLIVWQALITSPVLVADEAVLQAGQTEFGHRVGRVAITHLSGREKTGKDREGFLRALPFCFISFYRSGWPSRWPLGLAATAPRNGPGASGWSPRPRGCSGRSIDTARRAAAGTVPWRLCTWQRLECFPSPASQYPPRSCRQTTAIAGRASSRPPQKVEIDRHRDPRDDLIQNLGGFLAQKGMRKLEIDHTANSQAAEKPVPERFLSRPLDKPSKTI